ncbi:MAG TPA: BON domain-containing protein [Kofleriaceae bacterium]|nr:BON domain-containing protein [Kofleriaceae bacterium]
MPTRPPRSYEEIVRRTVPNPDSSFRPSQEVERRARQGYRALSPEEQKLSDDIHDALITAGIPAANLSIEVVRDHVVLRGNVRDVHTDYRVEEVVRGVEGVRSVVNQLVIERG